jgi:hypothetical protein
MHGLVTVSMQELDRLKCIQAVVEGSLKPVRAAERLGMTSRQVAPAGDPVSARGSSWAGVQAPQPAEQQPHGRWPRGSDPEDSERVIPGFRARSPSVLSHWRWRNELSWGWEAEQRAAAWARQLSDGSSGQLARRHSRKQSH